VLLCIIITIVNPSHDAKAQRRGGRTGRQERGGSTRTREGGRNQQAQEAQAEKRQQALENAVAAIDADLLEMLNLVNQQRRPGKNQLDSAKETIQKSRRYMKQLQDNMAGQFLMLNAWTDYFDAGAEKALSPATLAYRKNQANNDAHATQTAIAVLAGKKPLVLREKSQTQELAATRSETGRTRRGDTAGSPGRQTRGRSRGQDMPNARGRGRGRTGPEADYAAGGAASYSANISSGNILNLNPDSIKADWLGRKVGQFRLNCLNGTTFEYNPAEANLCVLFWKLAAADLAQYGGSESSEPNDITEIPQISAPLSQSPSYPSRSGRRERTPQSSMFDRRMLTERRSAFFTEEATTQTDPASTQISELGNLFRSKFKRPDVKFIALNTNNPKAAPAVVAKLLQSPWPWAQAMLDEDTAGSAFAELDITKKVTSDQPVLAVIDKTGTVRYAGPAAGFLPPMLVDDLLSGSTDPKTGYDSPKTIDKPRTGLQVSHTQPAVQLSKTSQTAPATNQQATDQIEPPQDTEITAEDFQAQKLLTYAQGLFIPAGQKGFMTSKMGVDLCRQILRKYPNTTYADEARKLLRSLPPDEQKKYNITPEEMGL